MNDVQRTIENPDVIRKSKRDPAVYLFYRLVQSKKWICVVVKQTDGDGFVITSYITDAIKEGEQVWTK